MNQYKYFEVHDCADPNKYIVGPNEDNLPSLYTKGSRNVFGARVMGINYADYCRICRDVFGATLVGKGTKYIIPYFHDLNAAKKFARYMSARMEKIMELLEEEKKCG